MPPTSSSAGLGRIFLTNTPPSPLTCSTDPGWTFPQPASLWRYSPVPVGGAHAAHTRPGYVWPAAPLPHLTCAGHGAHLLVTLMTQ